MLLARPLSRSKLFIAVLFAFTFQHVHSTAVYTPSDAYQESALKPVKSFSDVAIFHYSVPSQTCKASWTFVAFSDDPNCDEQHVKIYLRSGGYPVVSIDNTSFPEDVLLPMDLGEEQYYVESHSHFQPKEMPQIEVANPSPGSWFAIAYIPEQDSAAIQQQGISHVCHYSLGSMASWTQEMNVHLLSPGAPIYVNNLTETTWFKVFIPENSWMFRIKFSTCILVEEDTTNSTIEIIVDITECLSGIGVSGDSLPTIVNPQSFPFESVDNESNTFFYETIQPQYNVYYYVAIQSKANYSFKLEVDIEECETTTYLDPIWTPSAMSSLSHVSKLVSTKTAPQETVTHSNLIRDYVSPHVTSVPKSHSYTCYPVLALTRIKHAQDFLDSFMFQGKEWFSSRLKLLNQEPVRVRFEILPFVDIGGTLITRLQFDEFFSFFSPPFVFIIDICLTRKIPAPIEGNERHINCPNDRLRMRLLSNETEKVSQLRLTPFPQPGIWYITLKAACINVNLTASNTTCEQEDIRLDLRVRLQPCLLDGDQCGSHGTCKENHFRHFFFSSCHCTDGWKGWACSDGWNSVSPYFTLFQTLLLILSNFFFLPAIYIAFKWKFYAEAVVYMSTMIFSSFYHACDTEGIQICLFKYDVLQFCDFYSAILSFWVTVVAMSGLPVALTSMAHMAGALGIALAVQSEKTGLWTFVLPVVAGISLMLLSWGRQCILSRNFKITSKLLGLIPGAALAATGLVLFAFLETEGNYKYVHSAWHATIALSITFLLPRSENIKTMSNNYNVSPLNDVNVIPQEINRIVVNVNSDLEAIDIGDYRITSDMTSLIH